MGRSVGTSQVNLPVLGMFAGQKRQVSFHSCPVQARARNVTEEAHP